MNPADDRKLPENSQANLDKKLDHAVKESFPTSDPVSVTVTKKAPDPANLPGAQSLSSGGGGTASSTAPGAGFVLEQATEMAQTVYAKAESAARGAADAAAGLAQDAYERGRAYARQSYPEAERQYRRAASVVREYTPENPLMIFLAGAAVGFTVAWLTQPASYRDGVPDYARTRRGYAPHWQRE